MPNTAERLCALHPDHFMPCSKCAGADCCPDPGKPCCNPDCGRRGTVFVGDLTTLGNWACSLCEVYIVGDGNDDA